MMNNRSVNRFLDLFRLSGGDESVPFARQDATELTVIPSASSSGDSDDSSTVENGKPPGGLGGQSNGGAVNQLGVGGKPSGEGNNSNIARKHITAWDAGWNVTNAIQGMFLVALPYAVLHGGYWSVLSLALAALITCYTGLVLVDCLYDTNAITGERVRVRETYVSIAEEVWGKRFASRIVHTAQFIELIMTCILYLVLCGDLLYNTIRYTPMRQSAWTLISCFLVLPCAFLKNLKAVSRSSFGNAIAHVIINVIILGFCFAQAGHWHWKDTSLRIHIHHFPVSLGIVVFSYTSHIFLPSLEGSMVDRRYFKRMMLWTHGLAGFFKAFFGYVCYLTFGLSTQEVISDNLPTHSFRSTVNIVLVAKALLSFPLPYFAAVELLERAFFQGRPQTTLPSCYGQDGMLTVWSIPLRMLLICVSVLLAVFIPHFAILMGLIGSFTGTMLSFVWPCWFHLKLKWHELKLWNKVLDITIMLAGAGCGCIGIIYSFEALVQTYISS